MNAPSEKDVAARYLSPFGNPDRVTETAIRAGRTSTVRDIKPLSAWIKPVEKFLDRIFGVTSESDDRPFLQKYGNLIALVGVLLAVVAIIQAWRKK